MPFKEQLASWLARWRALPLRRRIIAIAGGATLLTAALLIHGAATATRHAVLFSNLSEEDAARIVERLRALSVDYQLEEGGRTILVPESGVHETRLTLSAEGLPSGGGVGYEIFDQQRFGESDFTEQVQFRRALEGELSRTLAHLGGVESVRVHLVLPERTLFARQARAATASVALRMRPGWRLREEQVRGVVHLVASSVPGLEPTHVTVVDGDGRPLTDGSDDEEQAGDTAEQRTQLERDRERAVQQMLDTALGAGVAVVRASAEVDASREERVEETYDPDRVATRSFEVTHEGGAALGAGAQGVPGAVSNLPGGPAAEAGVAGDTSSGRRSERRNFEITKTIRRAVSPVGRLSRLTVAVLVDGRWQGSGSARRFVPRPEVELARIRAIVESAAGIDPERGDRVTVECVPFASSTDRATERSDTLAPDPLAFLPAWARPYALYAAGGGVLLVLLAAGLLVRRRRLARVRREAEARAALQPALPAPDDTLELASEQGPSPDARPEEDPAPTESYEQLRALALEVARRDPELAARVIRGWLCEGDQAEQAKSQAEAA
ncbi:MAG: flagellar M-ring protein FliF [Sandaracinaceae bacterium]|nr:flagellar M-ring protein FliF [Sandaracinaceae bacterium]